MRVRPWFLLASLALGLTLGARPDRVGAQSPAPSVTAVQVLVPVSSSGLNYGLTASERLSGTCFAGSIAVSGRPDAWRCTAGNRILDPCFQALGGNTLACATSPWTLDVVALTLTAPPPEDLRNRTPESLTQTRPWALELTNGTAVRCSPARRRVSPGCA